MLIFPSAKSSLKTTCTTPFFTNSSSFSGDNDISANKVCLSRTPSSPLSWIMRSTSSAVITVTVNNSRLLAVFKQTPLFDDLVPMPSIFLSLAVMMTRQCWCSPANTKSAHNNHCPLPNTQSQRTEITVLSSTHKVSAQKSLSSPQHTKSAHKNHCPLLNTQSQRTKNNVLSVTPKQLNPDKNTDQQMITPQIQTFFTIIQSPTY